MAKYDIILQNNASKETFIISGVSSTGNSRLYLEFENLEMPEGAQDGEYTYTVVRNELEGVSYKPQNGLLESVVEYDGQSYALRDLKPLVGLLRIGNVEDRNVYKDDDKNKIYYYKK